MSNEAIFNDVINKKIYYCFFALKSIMGTYSLPEDMFNELWMAYYSFKVIKGYGWSYLTLSFGGMNHSLISQMSDNPNKEEEEEIWEEEKHNNYIHFHQKSYEEFQKGIEFNRDSDDDDDDDSNKIVSIHWIPVSLVERMNDYTTKRCIIDERRDKAKVTVDFVDGKVEYKGDMIDVKYELMAIEEEELVNEFRSMEYDISLALLPIMNRARALF